MQSQQNVDGVPYAVGPDWSAVAVLHDAINVPQEISPARIRKHRQSVFGCEYGVIKNLRVGGYVQPLRGWPIVEGGQLP